MGYQGLKFGLFKKMYSENINGWIFIDKPIGLSSNRTLGIIKKTFMNCKAGFVGTLDPLASGFLPVALGKSTKTIKFLSHYYKEYIFQVEWGAKSSTGDLEGEIEKDEKNIPSKEKIKKLLEKFNGVYYQKPHRFSSKKIGGIRAYKLARENKEFNLKTQRKTIFDLQVIDFVSSSKTLFYIKCSSGTYIRSLAEDMANLLKTYGMVTSLRRIGFGNLDKKLISLDYLLSLGHIDDFLNILKPVDLIFDKFTQIYLDKKEFGYILNGRPIEMKDKKNFNKLLDSEFILAKFKNESVAIGYFKDGIFYPKNLLNNFLV